MVNAQVLLEMNPFWLNVISVKLGVALYQEPCFMSKPHKPHH